MLRLTISATSIPERRERAAKLFSDGFSQAEVARRCGVSRTTAMRWYRAWIQRGKRDLEPLQRGRPALVSGAKLERLVQGPTAHGFTTELWTLERVSAVIAKVSGVRYHPGHVWRILRRLGWSLQKPTTRARERDEVEIARWKRRTWTRLKKTP